MTVQHILVIKANSLGAKFDNSAISKTFILFYNSKIKKKILYDISQPNHNSLYFNILLDMFFFSKYVLLDFRGPLI